MSLYGSGALYQRFIYRGASSLPQPVLSEFGDLDEFWIKVYNRNGILQHFLTNKVGRGKVHELKFDLRESGPGSCDFYTSELLDNASYDYSVEIGLYGTEETTRNSRVWWSGYLDLIPDPSQRSGPYKYRAQGFYSQLKRVIVQSEEFIDSSIFTIIQGILENFESREGWEIIWNPAKISPNTYYIPQIKFKGVNGQKVFEQLAEIAKNHLVGVDAYKEMFFRPVNFSVNSQLIFVEGRDYISSKVEADTSRIVNKIYPKIGTIQDGSNLLDPIEDADSIATYGLREDIVDLPSVFTTGAKATLLATRWALGYLNNYKQPRIKGNVKGVKQKYNAPMTPEGLCRLIQLNGTQIEGYAKKITYTIKTSLNITIDLGWPDDILTMELAKLERKQQFLESIQEMNAEQI